MPSNKAEFNCICLFDLQSPPNASRRIKYPAADTRVTGGRFRLGIRQYARKTTPLQRANQLCASKNDHQGTVLPRQYEEGWLVKLMMWVTDISCMCQCRSGGAHGSGTYVLSHMIRLYCHSPTRQTTLAASLTIVGSALGAGRQASWIASAYFITSTSFQLLYACPNPLYTD